MGQAEILEWLKEQRESGDDTFYSPDEIQSVLKIKIGFCNERSLRDDLWTLTRFGFLERAEPRSFRNWSVSFRYKLLQKS